MTGDGANADDVHEGHWDFKHLHNFPITLVCNKNMTTRGRIIWKKSYKNLRSRSALLKQFLGQNLNEGFHVFLHASS